MISAAYVSRIKGWNTSDYSIEVTGETDKAGNRIVNIIHKDDKRALLPGAGKSVELHIDMNQEMVVKEMSFQ
jgi:hypothetical protein